MPVTYPILGFPGGGAFLGTSFGGLQFSLHASSLTLPPIHSTKPMTGLKPAGYRWSKQAEPSLSFYARVGLYPRAPASRFSASCATAFVVCALKIRQFHLSISKHNPHPTIRKFAYCHPEADGITVVAAGRPAQRLSPGGVTPGLGADPSEIQRLEDVMANPARGKEATWLTP